MHQVSANLSEKHAEKHADLQIKETIVERRAEA
jgi:hypothetical protein